MYESVYSFNNRDGGHIFLGVVDKNKEICGVNPDKIDKMKKDFTTVLNNANKINPPLYLTLEDYDIDGKKIIYIHVPEGTQLRRLNGRIFDRTYEGDIDITDNAGLVYKMYARKQSTYFVNKVYPNLGLEFLDFDVIKRAKKMAMGRVDNHAWADMNEEEILRSSGLILTNPDTGREGITLAAILLFGKDSTIMSVLPQYKIDAIYDDENEIPRTIQESYFNPTRLLGLQSRVSAAYKGIIALVLKNHCKDFISGREMDFTVYKSENVDIHHIFPRAHCESKGYEKALWNSVVNKTPITYSTNREIGGVAPSVYLSKIEAKGQVTREELDSFLETHWINVDSCRLDDFQIHIINRAKRILVAIETATGKTISGKDSEEVVDRFGESLL